MTDKEAIELLKQSPNFLLRFYERENAINILLNLIKRQQEEIGELKEKLQNETISKDKIMAKINEMHGGGTFDAEIVLLKLLEEN